MKIKGDGQEQKLTPDEHTPAEPVWHGDMLCVHVIERMHMSCRILEKKEALWQQTVHHKICEYWKQNEKLWDWISPFSGNHQPRYLWHLTKKSFS